MDVVLVLALALACVLPAPAHAYSTLRMSGARDASISQYPFMAIVVHGRSLVGNGVIIAPRWVLTAASALLIPRESLYCVILGGDSMSTGRWYELTRVYRHPEWINYEYNVGMLHTRKTIQYGLTIQPIAVSYANLARMDVTMLSYGQNDQGPSHLQESEYTLTSDNQCIESLQERYGKVTIVRGHGYCIMWPPGPAKTLWQSDVGAPAVVNGEVVALFSIAESHLATGPYDFIATRLGEHEIRSWIDSMIRG